MTLTCQHCGKRLSRKTARQIEGAVMCSPCMFAPRKSGVTRMGGDLEQGSGPEGTSTRSAEG